MTRAVSPLGLRDSRRFGVTLAGDGDGDRIRLRRGFPRGVPRSCNHQLYRTCRRSMGDRPQTPQDVPNSGE